MEVSRGDLVLHLSEHHGDCCPGACVYVRTTGLEALHRLSHRTGQITHHIAPDINAERDHLMASLSAAGRLAERYDRSGIGATQRGRNPGGEPYVTDGVVAVGVLNAGAGP